MMRIETDIFFSEENASPQICFIEPVNTGNVPGGNRTDIKLEKSVRSVLSAFHILFRSSSNYFLQDVYIDISQFVDV